MSKVVKICAENLTVAYGSNVLMKNVSFEVNQGDVFIVMGGSGCGKSSLLRVLTGLKEPSEGRVCVEGQSLYDADESARRQIMRQCGILYQSGALFSSMTLAENIALPLQQYTNYSAAEIRDLCDLKLALVGLKGYGDFYPSEISGGMKKRAGLARALALDPEVLYFDEPSAGLDPVSSTLLDELIVELNQSLGTTIVVITHELRSIFAIGTNSIYLDSDIKNISARGNPKELLKNPPCANVLHFLTGGKK
jgi:phospholipid/cholesterol/gamma-HCH transport system ATP-binding protein